MTNVLMVTSTMWMLNWVHCYTSNSWPVVSLCLSLVPGGVGLKEWLIGSLSTSANSNHSSAGALNSLAEARGEANTGASSVLRVADHNTGGSRGASDGSAVSELSLNVGDDGAFGHGVDGEHVANSESRYYNYILKGLPLVPQYKNWPEYMPSTAMKYSVRCLYLY